MALRAGYYGVKRFLRNKLETIARTYDETIESLFPRSEQAVLGAKNLAYANQPSDTVKTVVCTVGADKSSVTLNGSPDNGNMAFQYYIGTFSKGSYIISGGDFTAHGVRVHIRWLDSSPGLDAISKDGDVAFSISDDTKNAVIYVYLNSGFTANNLVVKPMIRLSTDTDANWVPHAMTNKELTDSAADQKTTINAIITAATGAADFAAFKAAMGAITPVTRSLSLTKEDITEEVKEDVEPEKTVTKKRTTKKTEEV